MIKGDYFGKLLKPLFSILLIGFFGFLGNSFVNAGLIQMVGIEGQPSMYDSNFNLTFLKGGGLLSSYLGQGKAVLALDSQTFLWWATNGQLYYYSNGLQGFFGEYWSCDVLTGYDSVLSNCNSSPITGDYEELFKSFFSKVDQYDLVYYDFVKPYNNSSANGSSRGDTIQVCWSSETIGKTLCFRKSSCYNSNSLNSCNGRNYGSLVNSQDLSNLSFSLISYNWIGKAPGQNGYGGNYNGSIDGSVVVNPDNTYTGDYTYTECTNGKIMNYIEKSGISPYLCQGGLDNWDLLSMTGIYDPIPGSGKWLDEIYGHTTNSGQLNSNEWFNYWNTAYVNQYVSNQNIWYSQPAVLRSYFKFYNEYGGNNFDFNTVYEYCLMRKFYTRDNQYATHKYQGQYFKKTCTYIQNNQNSDNEGGNAGESVNGLNWNGVGNLSGGKTYNDPGQFITDMFTKIKSYIPTDGSDVGLGFLPAYIITFMLFLMLFRFLSH